MVCCCVVNCSERTEKGTRLFLLPRGEKNKLRRKKWIINIKRENLPTHAYVCEKHFTKDQFENNRADKKRPLRWDAVPTIFKHKKTKTVRKRRALRKNDEEDVSANGSEEEISYLEPAVNSLIDPLEDPSEPLSISKLEQPSSEQDDDPSWRMPITVTKISSVVGENTNQIAKNILPEVKRSLSPSNEIVTPTKILVIEQSIEDSQDKNSIPSISVKKQRSVSPAEIEEISDNFENYQIKEAPRILVVVPYPCVTNKETDCVRFLRKQAKVLDLTIKVVTLVPDKPVVVLTWLGSQPELPAILLNSHMDVVPVSEEHWDHPPFAAEIDSKGNIFARGSQDMKCVGIMYLEAVRRLKNNGITLKRTLHLSFVPDEEIGGKDGMGIFSTSKEFQELNIGFSLDEGVVHNGDEFIVFYAEKIIWQLHVHCRGTPGHGSSLQGNTSGEKFRYMVDKFLDYRDQQQQLNGPMLLPGDDISAINLTKVYGGLQENIIPDQLTAVFDIRHSIKQNLTEFEEMINTWCKEAGPDVTIEYKQKDQLGGVTVLDRSNPFWIAFKSASDKLNLKLRTVTCPGSTDSRFIRLLGIPALGFTPINKTPIRLHAHNEFVNKNSVLEGIQIYYDILQAIANV